MVVKRCFAALSFSILIYFFWQPWTSMFSFFIIDLKIMIFFIPMHYFSISFISMYIKYYQLIFFIFKVACTNWKRILMILTEKWNDTNVLSIPASLAHSTGMFPSLGNFSEDERANIVDNYTKLIFVRHPFERLLSAYRNKLEDESPSASYFQVNKTIHIFCIHLSLPCFHYS